MAYVIGIDQGSSKTYAAVSNMSGRILGAAIGPGGYHTIHGMDVAMQAIRAAAEMALRAAGIDQRQVAVLYSGMTGADWPDEYDLLQRNVATLGLAQQVYVTNDSLVALRGGTDAPYGVIVIAGTGANCALRTPAGETFTYHFYHDDELQGGSALGRLALRAVYRAATWREPPTLLTNMVLEMFRLPDVDALLRDDVEGRLPGDQIRHIAPLIFQAACADDRVACDILKSFGAGLAELVTAALVRFDMAEQGVDVVLSGSIFKGQGRLLETVMLADIQAVAPYARLVNAHYEPVVGAVLLGLECCNVVADERVKANIEATSQQLGLIRRVLGGS